MLRDPPSRQVQSVRTTFRIVGVLQELGGATPATLTRRLDVSKSSVHNYLSTLEMMGYVVNEGGIYRLGLRFLTHGFAAKRSTGLDATIDATVQSIGEDLSLLTWWVTEEYGRGYFLSKSTPDDQDELFGGVGKRSYLHTHAAGKAILASLPEQYVERIVEYHGLPERTTRTITDREALFDELATIRDRGFAVSDGETMLGILSVGVGFQDSEGRTHAVGVFGYSRDFAGERTEAIGEQLVDAIASLENDEVLGE